MVRGNVPFHPASCLFCLWTPGEVRCQSQDGSGSGGIQSSPEKGRPKLQELTDFAITWNTIKLAADGLGTLRILHSCLLTKTGPPGQLIGAEWKRGTGT